MTTVLTIDVKDAGGITKTVNALPNPGRQADALSTSVALSTEDVALFSPLATAAKQPAFGVAGTPAADVTTIQGSASGTPVPVTNALGATAAKQPAFGVAGTPAADVQTMQGVANGTPVAVSTTTSSIDATSKAVTAAAYTAGKQVGPLLAFANAVGASGGGVIQSGHLAFKTVQTAVFKLYLFSQIPNSGAYTDATTPSINAADIPFLIDVITFSVSDSGLGTHTLYAVDGISKAFKLTSSTTLYGILITTGAPTFASTSDLVSVILDIMKDSA